MNTVFLAIAAMVMVIIIAAVYGIFLLLNPTRTASDRLRDARGEEEDEGDIDLLVAKYDDEDPNAFSRLMTPSSEEDRNIMRRKLIQAGYKHPRALEMLNFTRIALAMGLPVILIPFASGLSPLYGGGVTLLACGFGYMGPYLLVENNINKRKDELLSAFPDSLDLLVSSVEAGLGIDAAFRRVANELEQASPLLAKEYQLVNNEISAGVPRVEALRRLEKRTGLDEIRSLVNMLAQAERFGTSVAASLRVHAEVTRQKRMARAEEVAARVSPKLTVVMILTLIPVLKLVLMGPAMIRVYRLWGAP